MLILTNCLTNKTDEGCLKVATNLTEKIKAACPETYTVTYERQSEMSDIHLNLNKLMLSRKLFRLLSNRNDPVLYIPSPAKPMATVLRIFLLSLFSKKRINVILMMKLRLNFFQKLLLKRSKARIIVFSKESEDLYKAVVGTDKVTYLKTGINTQKFHAVSQERAKALKIQYGFDPDRPLVLHVGHLKYGRGVAELLKISDEYQVLLVASTLTKDEQDETLRQQLQSCPHVKIMDDYLPNIEEIYQLSDVYFFPVKASGNCIDIPLSCLEAASCGKSVITTDYGEMREFIGKPGFYFVDGIEKENLNRLIGRVLQAGGQDPRASVLDYDWSHAVSYLLNT